MGIPAGVRALLRVAATARGLPAVRGGFPYRPRDEADLRTPKQRLSRKSDVLVRALIRGGGAPRSICARDVADRWLYFREHPRTHHADRRETKQKRGRIF